MGDFAIIGGATGWGAQVRETEKGPEVLQHSDILKELPQNVFWKEIIHPQHTAQEIQISPSKLTLPYIEDVDSQLSNSTEEALKTGHFPVVIGGDHSIACGTWAAVTHHYDAQGEFGLLWIDAHMDAHTPETTPSYAYHGMPVAVLLGQGEKTLIDIAFPGSSLNPKHVVLIGVRSFEEGEAEFLKKSGVRIYFMDEIHTRGFETVLKEALSIVKNGTKGFGVSFDLDAFDPTIAPGVGTPEPNGLTKDEVLSSLSLIQDDPAFKALEIVEYNPERDKNQKTLLLIKDLLMSLLPRKGESR